MRLSWFAVTLAHLLSWHVTAADDSQIPLHPSDAVPSSHTGHVHRVAIIGAGAAGSSAAYHLRRFLNLWDCQIPLNITVFDTNSRVGGRTTTVNALDDPRYPTELGASIFVEVNHILYNATRDFGLKVKTKIFEPTADAQYELGIWNGREFVFTQANEEGSLWKGWWDIAKLLWKYGMSPIRTQRLTKNIVGRFLKFYDDPIFPFATLQSAVEQADLLDFTGRSGEETLELEGVSREFSRDIIQASTRVNYAQNLGGIHGLETLVCMAIEGAMAVDGGNWQIFDQAVKHAHAFVQLNTTVTEVERTDKATYMLHTSPTADIATTSLSEYDTVILAAPYQFANITFSPPLEKIPSPVPYVPLHVTLFTSPHLLSSAFFNQTTQSAVPSTILTTLPAEVDLGAARGLEAVGPASFWSISTLRTIPSSTPDSSPQYLYKIFSPAALTGSFLASLLSITNYTNSTADDPISHLPKPHLTWFHEKKWHSYPYLPPTREFAPFRLDSSLGAMARPRPESKSKPESDSESESESETKSKTDADRDTEAMTVKLTESSTRHLGRGIWYTSGMEPFISTMETSALAGMNVAKLIALELETKHVVLSSFMESRREGWAETASSDDVVDDDDAK